MGTFTDVLSLVFFITALPVAFFAISLAISVPLAGALIRFRAHYNPMGLQLDPEGGVQPHTGPVIKSFFAMLARVYRIEGWSGLYKGLMPTLLSFFITNLPLLVFVGYGNLLHGTFSTPESTGLLRILAYIFSAALVSLPIIVIIDRAVTTPYKLPYFKPVYSLRILLTPTERRCPWTLYLAPGLLVGRVSIITYVLALRTVRRLLLSELVQPGRPLKEDAAVRLAIFLAVALASTVALTPLEVIIIRLAVQRNHAAPEVSLGSQEEGGRTEDTPEHAGSNEDVINLRTEREPYTGLVDCAKKIIDEEGWSALYRAWWLTMLGCLVGVSA